MRPEAKTASVLMPVAGRITHLSRRGRFGAFIGLMLCGTAVTVWLDHLGDRGPEDTYDMLVPIVYGVCFVAATTRTIVYALHSIKGVSNAQRSRTVTSLLNCFPRAIRDDAEGMFREFVELRRREREAGRPLWRTAIKCTWYVSAFLIGTAVRPRRADL
jgi:hypothetical protein